MGAAMIRTRTVTIIVPCYNEAARLTPSAFSAFAAEEPQVRFLFVDDGSTDATGAILQRLCRPLSPRFEVMTLPRNVGQGESVRLGIRRALARGDDYVGFWDADLAASLSEIPRFVEHLDTAPACLMVLGSRSPARGRQIERTPSRRFLGRLFASVARAMLDMPIYDTQCGAKLFRRSSEIETIFALPFISRWIFDVELLARLIRIKGSAASAHAALCELPLEAWRDVEGSKLKPSDFARAPWEMARIGRELYR